MPDEIVLEKYVNEPINLLLDDSAMLQCGNVVVAENVKCFDAATDVNGNIHGIYMSSDGKIIYFRMKNSVAVNKIIASFVNPDTDMSLTEDGGTLHILIVSNGVVYHFFTKGDLWKRSDKLMLKEGFMYVSSCPCGKNKFAILVSHNADDIMYVNDNGKWSNRNIVGLPEDKETVTMSFYKGNMEIYYIERDCVKTIVVGMDDESENNINRNGEIKMANGNMINSKFIEQVNDNSRRVDNINETLTKLENSVENIEKQIKQLNMYKENAKSYEIQINQLGIKIQELSNRFNGILKIQNNKN